MRLEILGIPGSKQSARFCITGGKVRSFQSAKVEKMERNIAYDVKQQLPAGFIPFPGGVIVRKLLYVFPPLKGFNKSTKAKIERGEKIYKTTKPDLTDNLNKAVFDALQGIVYDNDSQICAVYNLEKIYGMVPKTIIEIESLSGG
jgi:Holliday junction resolvase RusA-like endonuclease